MQLIARFLFKLLGWSISGQVPNLNKFVVIIAPHTSAWDLPLAMLAKFILNVQFAFLAKQEIFKPPFGFIFKALGGVAVNRSASHNMVDQAVKTFAEREHFILALSPEGTRKYVAKWKTGFYYIALQAHVPIVLAFLDYEKKQAGIGPTFYPTGNAEQDIEAIKAFYRTIKGRHPEQGVL
ncbi:MAG: lysophospholipid acyltransferase family protein [Chitinophagales bacterium]|nr:lysophospholipid acyltransferase family protein [Chitinophagales bacterium]